MKLDSLEVENFKNVKHVSIKAEGDHIILSGPSGAGKSAITGALRALFGGKKDLPKGDAIRHGEETASVETVLKSGDKTYKAALSITAKGEYWRINEIRADGKAVAIGETPLQFFKRVCSSIMFEAKKFFSTSDKEALELLYNALPGLKEKIDANLKRYADAQAAHKDALSDVTRARARVAGAVEHTGVPAQEVDASTMIAELSRAEAHNRQADALSHEADQIGKRIDGVDRQIAAIDADIRKRKEMIEQLMKAIADAELDRDKAVKDRTELDKQRSEIMGKQIAFEPIDTAEIRAKLANLEDTNRKVRANIQRAKDAKEADAAAELASAKLKEMRAIEDERKVILESADIPVPGLTIGDGCLMYPDPVSGVVVPISELSDGQRWPVVAALYAAVCPGLRLLYIDDYSAIDAANRKILHEVAAKHDLQLLIHETTQTADGGIGILICGGEVAEGGAQ